MFKRITTILLIAIPLISCNQERQVEKDLVNDAKLAFSSSASTLSLPCRNTSEQTKSMDFLTNVYPIWDEAIFTGTEDSYVIEAPLRGSCRIAGAVITGTDADKESLISASRSFLVADYRDASDPKFYVESFIEKGRKTKATYFSDKSKMTGFMLISDLNGKIEKRLAYKDGQEFEIQEGRTAASEHKPCHVFFGYRLGYEILTKDSYGCPEDYLYVCVRCFRQFYGPMGLFDFTCPNCRALLEEEGDYFCERCGRLWDFCCCQNPDYMCAPCGRLCSQCNCNCRFDAGSHSGYCTCDE